MEYTCGYCDRVVASDRGWTNKYQDKARAELRICPHCDRPTFFEGDEQYPEVTLGEPIKHLPAEIETLYNEARAAAGASAPTASVLALRKLLMNIAVHKGANPDQSFQQYVDYLSDQGYLPKDSKGWVDHIRNKGNEANHQIKLMTKPDAEQLLVFASMLLKIVYELPGSLPKPYKTP